MQPFLFLLVKDWQMRSRKFDCTSFRGLTASTPAQLTARHMAGLWHHCTSSSWLRWMGITLSDSTEAASTVPKTSTEPTPEQHPLWRITAIVVITSNCWTTASTHFSEDFKDGFQFWVKTLQLCHVIISSANAHICSINSIQQPDQSRITPLERHPNYIQSSNSELWKQ